MKRIAIAAAALAVVPFAATETAEAAAHAQPKVVAADQDVSNGIVSAKEIVAGANGWMVVHRVKADGKPGPVVGHAPLRAGINTDVAAILTEPVASGDQLMLMIHAEDGGTKTGIFEYTLGAKEDGPIRVDGNLVMQVIAAK
ncbi:MAG: hypothetical protein AAGF90_10440 [Pseudomonadota bacterium]